MDKKKGSSIELPFITGSSGMVRPLYFDP